MTSSEPTGRDTMTDMQVAQKIADALPTMRLIVEVMPVLGRPGLFLARGVNGDSIFIFDGPACRFHFGHGLDSPLNPQDVQYL